MICSSLVVKKSFGSELWVSFHDVILKSRNFKKIGGR